MSKVCVLDGGYYLHASGLMLMGKIIKEKTNVNCCNQKMEHTITPENHITLECLICHKVIEFDLDYQEIRANNIPYTYQSATMIIGDLKRIGIDKDDIIILAKDARNSWRKDFQKSYKSGRMKLLPEMYDEFDWMLKKFNEGSNFHILCFPRTEFDDIGAVAVRYFKDKEVVVVSSDCLSGDTLVKMADNTVKKLSQVKTGDYVLSYNINSQRFEAGRVTATHQKTHEEQIVIYHEGHKRPIKSSTTHKFYTTQGWKTAEELKVGDELFYLDKSKFPKIKWEDSYKIGYINGLVEGDGYYTPDGRGIKIELNDIEPLERVQKYLKQIFNYEVDIKESYHSNKKKSYKYINFHLGVGHHILERYKHKKPSKQYKQGFLAGFFDAEGSKCELKYQLSGKIDNTDMSLLTQAQQYCTDLGIQTSKIFLGGRKANYNDVYRFSMAGVEFIKFLHTCRPALLRKYPKWNFHTSFLHNGKKITAIKRERFTHKRFQHYDLTVAKWSNYVINSSFVVHNSDMEQLISYPNCRIFKPKCKRYWIPPKNYNAYEQILKKINKEVSDGLKTAPENETEFNQRELCVSLLSLPEHIEKPIIEALDTLPDKYIDISKLPYRTIQNRFMSIYDKKDVITYEKCVKYEERMKNKSKKTLKKK